MLLHVETRHTRGLTRLLTFDASLAQVWGMSFYPPQLYLRPSF